MAFEARVLIQGVGLVGRSDDGQRLEAHFPTPQAGVDFGLTNDKGVPQHELAPQGSPPICPHYAFVQFSARNLDGANEDVWLTTMLDRETVDVEVTGANVKPLTVGADGAVDKLANLNAVLEGIVASPRQLRAELDQVAGRQRFLQAMVRVSAGGVAGFKPHRWDLGKLPNGQPRELLMSGATQIELGPVDELALRITAFDNSATRRLRLLPNPSTGDVEVWIRHFCSFVRPNPNDIQPLTAGLVDIDFLLNYSLLEGTRSLSGAQKRQLPLPVIRTPGIGGQHALCQTGGR